MAANSVTILPSSSHSADSTNSPIVGEKYKGAGYYGMGDGFHSVQIQVTDFSGIISIQGTLATNPTDSDWVDVLLNDSITSLQLSAESHNQVYNFIGNFVWVRANISSWTDGHINRIMLNF